MPALAATAIAAASATIAVGLPPACPLHLATGFDCPFCGGTRALAALGRLDVVDALDHNALVVVALAIAGLWWARRIRAARRLPVAETCLGSGPGHRSLLLMAPSPGAVTLLSLGALAVFTVLRNLPSSPWHFLASGA